MEQHPVPQNVTTFQFRLIGDMTIKQFGYLAGGAVVGYISYKLPLPFFFTWPMAITSVTLGIGLAFVPIEERPMDVWLLSFIKSIYSPTQYLWQKTAPPKVSAPPPKTPSAVPSGPQPMVQPSTTPGPATAQVIIAKQSTSIAETLEHLFSVHPKPKVQPLPATPIAPPKPAPAPSQPTPIVHMAPARPAQSFSPSTIWSQRTWDPFGWVKHLFPFSAPSKSAHPASAYPDIFAGSTLPSLTGKKVDLPREAPAASPAQAAAIAAVQAQAQTKEQELTKKLESLQTELTTKTTSDARILELQKQLTDVLSERSKMETELVGLRQKLTQRQIPQEVVRPMATTQVQTPGEPTVRIITADTALKAGLPRLTTFPNVVTGIIKDNEGSLLPGVLVTVRDKEDMPVRALKTNKLGQFAASTPLPSGTYTVDIEDPRQLHFFDRVRISLNGAVMSPIEVTSRSKKQIERSKLEKAIFGNQNT